MVVTILGIKRGIDFTDDKGTRICGTKLFWSFPESGVEGEMTEAKFFKFDNPLFSSVNAFIPGDRYNVVYGRNNKVDGFQPVD